MQLSCPLQGQRDQFRTSATGTPDGTPVNPLQTAPKPGALLGTAITIEHSNNPPAMEDNTDETKKPDDNQTDETDTKKKTFITKEYGLKRRTKTKRKFKSVEYVLWN